MCKHLTVIIILISICQGCKSSIKDYVKSNTVSIDNIDTTSENYEDLEPIGKAIGNARIVMLGEQDHGDAPTFLAKTRLVKYLHEKKGFNVLAFESDFFALTKGWDELPKNKPVIDTFLRKNIFSIWTGCDACHHLFYDYIPSTFSTDNPLNIAGFDNQVCLAYSKENLSKQIDSVFIKLNLPLAQNKTEKDSTLFCINILINSYGPIPDSIYSVIESKLNTAKKQLSVKTAKNDYWVLVISNLIELNNQYRTFSKRYIQSNFIRDKQMDVNLNWICNEKYPNEKIIVWAANGHIMKYTDSIKSKRVFMNMGTLFAKNNSSNTYVMGFTSFHGEAGRITIKNKYRLASPAINSFERWIDKDYQYSFTDFKKYNETHPANQTSFRMKGAGHFSINTYWNKVFDGVFFIRDMYPCKQIQ